VLGGVITDVLSWHWIFFINVPVGALALILGRRLIAPQAGIGLRQGADVAGAILVTGAPMLTVYALVNAADSGWGSPLTVGPLVAALATAGLFLVVEERARSPLVPLSVFRNHNLVSATIVRTLFPMGAMGYNFISVLYAQHVLGFSPLLTGLAILPSTPLTGLFSLALVPWLMSRFGPKALVISGLALVTAGMVAFIPVPVDGHLATNILPTMILTGAGFGLLFMPSVSIALSDVTPRESGLASGLVNVALQLGAAIGVAALATVSTARTRHLLAQHVPGPLALTGGFRAAMVVAVGCTTSSLVAAVVLLRPRRATVAESRESSVMAPARPLPGAEL
jgi:MFS family permease